MAEVPPLPDAAAPIADSTGRVTQEYYRFFTFLAPLLRLAKSAVQGEPWLDETILHNDEADTLTVGFTTTPYDNGTKSSGTFTVDQANGALQKVTIAGAVTFGLPADGTSLQILIVMASGAAIPNIDAFEFPAGADLDAVVGNKFMASISNISGEGTFTAIAGKGNT